MAENNKRDAKHSIDSLQEHLPKLQKLNTWTGAVLSEQMIGFDQESKDVLDRSPVCRITKELPRVSYDNVSSFELTSQTVNGEETFLLSNRKKEGFDQTNTTAFTDVEKLGYCTDGRDRSLQSHCKGKGNHERLWTRFTDVQGFEPVALRKNLESFETSDDKKENPSLGKNEEAKNSWDVFYDVENEDLDHAELKVWKKKDLSLELESTTKPYRADRVEQRLKIEHNDIRREAASKINEHLEDVQRLDRKIDEIKDRQLNSLREKIKTRQERREAEIAEREQIEELESHKEAIRRANRDREKTDAEYEAQCKVMELRQDIQRLDSSLTAAKTSQQSTLLEKLKIRRMYKEAAMSDKLTAEELEILKGETCENDTPSSELNHLKPTQDCYVEVKEFAELEEIGSEQSECIVVSKDIEHKVQNTTRNKFLNCDMTMIEDILEKEEIREKIKGNCQPVVNAGLVIDNSKRNKNEILVTECIMAEEENVRQQELQHAIHKGWNGEEEGISSERKEQAPSEKTDIALITENAKKEPNGNCQIRSEAKLGWTKAYSIETEIESPNSAENTLKHQDKQEVDGIRKILNTLEFEEEIQKCFKEKDDTEHKTEQVLTTNQTQMQAFLNENPTFSTDANVTQSEPVKFDTNMFLVRDVDAEKESKTDFSRELKEKVENEHTDTTTGEGFIIPESTEDVDITVSRGNVLPNPLIEWKSDKKKKISCGRDKKVKVATVPITEEIEDNSEKKSENIIFSVSETCGDFDQERKISKLQEIRQDMEELRKDVISNKELCEQKRAVNMARICHTKLKPIKPDSKKTINAKPAADKPYKKQTSPVGDLEKHTSTNEGLVALATSNMFSSQVVPRDKWMESDQQARDKNQKSHLTKQDNISSSQAFLLSSASLTSLLSNVSDLSLWRNNKVHCDSSTELREADHAAFFEKRNSSKPLKSTCKINKARMTKIICMIIMFIGVVVLITVNIPGKRKSFETIPINDTAAEHGELGERKEVVKELIDLAFMMESTTAYQLDDAELIKPSTASILATEKSAQPLGNTSKEYVESELSIEVLIRSSPISYNIDTNVQAYYNTQSLPNHLHNDTKHASMTLYSETPTRLSSSATKIYTALPISKSSTTVLALSFISSSLLSTVTSATIQQKATTTQSTSVSVPGFAILDPTDFVVTKISFKTPLSSNMNSKPHTLVTSTVLPETKSSTPVLALSLSSSSLLSTVTSATFQQTATTTQSTSVSTQGFAILVPTDSVTKQLSTINLPFNMNSKLHTLASPKRKSIGSHFAVQETKQISPTFSSFPQLNAQSVAIQLPKTESIILSFQYLLEEVKTIFRQWHRGNLDNLYEECLFTYEQLNTLFSDAEATNLVPMSDAEDCYEIEKMDSDITGQDSLRITEDPLIEQLKLLVWILKKYFDERVPCNVLGTVTSMYTSQSMTVQKPFCIRQCNSYDSNSQDKASFIRTTTTTRAEPTTKTSTAMLEQLAMATKYAGSEELSILVTQYTKLASALLTTKPMSTLETPNASPMSFRTRLTIQKSIEIRETKIDPDKSSTETIIAATRMPSSISSVATPIGARTRRECPSRWYTYPLYIFRCRRGRRIIPHPYNCRKFILCWRRMAFIGVCRHGMVFNPLINLCDWSGYQFC